VNKLAQAVMLLACILEVLASNCGQILSTRKLTRAITLLTCICEVPGSNLSWTVSKFNQAIILLTSLGGVRMPAGAH
jgi:hypothetical protein